MPSNRAKELWNSGIPLNRAWLEFAQPKLRFEFDSSPDLLQSLAAISETEIRHGFLSSLAQTTKNAHRRGQLEIEMKEHLLEELFNAQLLATGYRSAPSRSQAPVLIDPEKFEHGDPDWKDETFEAHGITYCRIRVTHPANCQPAPARGQGSREAIDAAIDYLKSVNPGFANWKRKIACEEIRQFLGSDEIAGNGLSDVNLSKAIVSKCGKRRISKN